MRFPEIDLNGIKGVLLDLDNTLYEYELCHQFALDTCYKEFNLEFDKNRKEFDLFYNNAKKKVHNDLHGQGSSHSRLLYFQKFFESLLGKTSILQTVKYEQLYWGAFLDKMALFDGVVEFLEKCTNLEIPICIITDLTAEIQYKKLLRLEIGKYINYIVSSEEAGCEKPSRYIFELALDKLKLQANDVLMIGDNHQKDIVGADSMAIKSFHITL